MTDSIHWNTLGQRVDRDAAHLASGTEMNTLQTKSFNRSCNACKLEVESYADTCAKCGKYRANRHKIRVIGVLMLVASLIMIVATT